MKRIQNFIDGEFRPPCSGRYIEDVDPATGRGGQTGRKPMSALLNAHVAGCWKGAVAEADR